MRWVYKPRYLYSQKQSKQPVKLPIVNFDTIVDHGREKKYHGELLSDSIRAVISGPSNCEKTNSLLALLTHPNGLRFENVYVYSKSLNQPKYKFLKKLLKPIDGIQYFPFNEYEEVVSPENALPNSIIIFDDIACEKQNNIRAFFCMGRHKNVDFYFCHSYAHVPKHLVKDNVNLLFLFRQDDANFKHLYDDHVNSDMSYTQFKNLCSKCWLDDKYGFLMIDKDRAINAGRYRKGFYCFAINMMLLQGVQLNTNITY